MQLDHHNDQLSSDEDDNHDGAHAVCKVMTSRSDPNPSRRELSDQNNDMEYVCRVRDVAKECPMIVSLILNVCIRSYDCI